ncbi:hypothetical protein E2562_000962 [Oryza meyeriana var. granulata]|uniref:Bowman-Birk serine protease inhibitors family domain-containing protein n=1 Tax=Oryza meyeriana var. granulata TaxID=110450 RepID=A0A6G1CYA7_9ORYZ|nr:hypothetical protein E2562_000962 [Oryza meyeriana var. granulata]
MASSLRKMISPLVAVLLLVAMETQAMDEAVAADDMVPVMAGIIGGGGGGVGKLGAPVCLQCRCCSKSNPSNCQITRCCSTFNCDPAGKCSLVQQQCGCSGC